jgi:hypothetical protein
MAHELIPILPGEESNSPPILVDYPPLSREEDVFVLALIEYSGNYQMAYKAAYGADVEFPATRGRELTNRPQIALRLRELTQTLDVSKEFQKDLHLMELANIRDLAKYSGQLKVALDSEVKRGEVHGVYAQQKVAPSVAVQVNFVSAHDKDI